MLALSRWKILLVVGSIIFGIVYSLPNVLPDSVLAHWPSFLPSKRLNLGLDLQGGSSLLYEVDTVALKKERLGDLGEEAASELRDAQITFSGLTSVNGVVQLKITDPAQFDQAATALGKVGGAVPGVGREVITTHDAAGDFQMALTPQAAQQDIRNAVTQSIEIIRRRIDLLGTKEPDIRQQGLDRIAIEAPGESDPQKLKDIVGQTAKLTFQMVDEDAGEHGVVLQAETPVPPDDVVLPEGKSEPFLVVKKRISVDGGMLTSAGAGQDDYNQPAVDFRLNGAGAHRFAQVTSENVGQRFAIILDNKVIEAPSIRSPIIGGSGQITGGFTADSAAQLALLLKSGALPAPLKVVQEGTVGADLGADSVHAGVVGLAIGAALIFSFIILAYGLFGVFAALALVVNLLLMFLARCR